MEVIENLIKPAKNLDDSAVQVMGDAKLKVIAAELISQVKKSVSIDWTLRQSARARIKVMVKRVLNRHGYPPELQEEISGFPDLFALPRDADRPRGHLETRPGRGEGDPDRRTCCAIFRST